MRSMLKDDDPKDMREVLCNNIVNEIVKECKAQNVPVDAKFCKFYTDLLMLDPNWGVSTDDILKVRQDVAKFIKYILDRLVRGTEPRMMSLILQFYFREQFDFLEDLGERNRKLLAMRLEPVRLSILEPNEKERRFPLILHRRVQKYIVLMSGMGDPNSDRVMNEIRAVLRSFWDVDQVKPFVNLPYVIKMEELDNLVTIASGIRLYNMDCRKGGEGIEDLPKLLLNAIRVVHATTLEKQRDITDRMKHLTVVVEKCYVLNTTGNKVTLDVRLPSYCVGGVKELEDCKDLLVVYNQYCAFLERILGELEELKGRAAFIKKQYKETLAYLHEHVIPNIHIRTSLIFPGFTKLYELWQKYQDTTMTLIGLKHIYKRQDVLVNKLHFENSLTTALCPIRRRVKIVDAQELDLPIHEEARLFTGEITMYLKNVKYEFDGYCCWKLVLCKGVLIKGDRCYGVCAYQNKFYVFSSPNGIESFARDPEYYLTRVVEECRNNAVLIHILEVKELMTLYKDQKVVRKEPIVYIPKRDVATTTDNEVVISGFDSNYSWNPWDYRRKALQEAKLMTMKTKSTQCTSTFMQSAVRLQTTDRKITKETQNKSDNYSNTPTPLAYIHGLRGRKDNKQEVLNMTYYDFPKKCEKTVPESNTVNDLERERFFKKVWEVLDQQSLHRTATVTDFNQMMKELEDLTSNDDDDYGDRIRVSFFSL
nr:unnamed protein product [Callosobruchus analis]